MREAPPLLFPKRKSQARPLWSQIPNAFRRAVCRSGGNSYFWRAGIAVHKFLTPRQSAVPGGNPLYKESYEQVSLSRRMNESSGLQSVFLANRPALARYLRARLRGDGESEDILQDLWLKLRGLEARPIADPLAYLYRMAENLVLDRRRSSMRRTNRETEWTKDQIEGTIEASIDARPSAERLLLARDHLRRVEAVLDSLPERTAEAFRAVRIDGTPQKDIASSMGISLSAVEKHLQRAYRAVLEVKCTASADQEMPDRHTIEGADDAER